MKLTKLATMTLLICLGLQAPIHFAIAEEDEIAKEETALADSAKSANFVDALKTKYSLTDEQVKAMQDKGLNNPQMAIVSQLATSSGKSIDEVMKMRVDDKMGWGEIAKALGVHPGEIGKSIASLRHDVNDKRHETKKEERLAKKELRDQQKKERRDQRELRKQERDAQKSKSVNGYFLTALGPRAPFSFARAISTRAKSTSETARATRF
jgi:hypothetical protein